MNTQKPEDLVLRFMRLVIKKINAMFMAQSHPEKGRYVPRCGAYKRVMPHPKKRHDRE